MINLDFIFPLMRPETRNEFFNNFDFFRKIFLNSEVNEKSCWLHKGELNRNGYTRVRYLGKRWMTHRLMFYIFNGELRKKRIILHDCDERACCNPRHLSQGTFKQNTMDMISKGRHFYPWSKENMDS